MVRRRWLLSLSICCGAIALTSCISPGEGPSPQEDGFYYPTGLAISPGGHTLYVANSDFDLRYHSGTVVSLDLDRLRDNIPAVWDAPPDTSVDLLCGSLGPNTSPLLYPSPCGPIDITRPADGLGSLVGASVEIGAFATDLIVTARQDAPGTRLFLPVRGDPSVTWIDVEDDRSVQSGFQRRLSCGDARCTAAHRTGNDPNANLRQAVLPPEPYGIAASHDGEVVVVNHQTLGSISLVTNDWNQTPTLQFVANGFPSGGVGLAALPVPQITQVAAMDYQPGFLTTFRQAGEIDLVRYHNDATSSPARPFLVRSGVASITVNSSGIDSRGIAVDSSKRQDCENRCNNDEPCLLDCAAIPLDVFIANRTPPSLLIGETRSNVSPTQSTDQVYIYDSVPLSYGPSKVVVGNVVNPNGIPETRVFVSCFDARYIVIYNPATRRVDGRIRTGRGPHALALDPMHPYLYVTHFTDSYIGVVDLDQRHARTYPSIVATVGVPIVPRESK